MTVAAEARPRPVFVRPDRVSVVDTEVGPLVVTAWAERLTGVSAPGEAASEALRLLAPKLQPTAPAGVLREAALQLQAYARRRLRAFDLPMELPESPMRPFWDACAAIPYGHTCSYGELASAAGHPGEARWAGAAMATNPLAVVIPCHRVVNSSGGLQGYGGGLRAKRHLLDLEGAPRSVAALAGWLTERHPGAERAVVAVRSTRIYCLPDCRAGARLDLERSVLHSFGSPEEAAASGFRACKLCRPDGPQGRLFG